jgi:hypothetical protein
MRHDLATTPVEPEINGSNSRSAPMQNPSVMAVGQDAVAGGGDIITANPRLLRDAHTARKAMQCSASRSSSGLKASRPIFVSASRLLA